MLIKLLFHKIFQNRKCENYINEAIYKIYRGISAENTSLLNNYIFDSVKGNMYFGTRASIYGTGMYTCSSENIDVARKYATDGGLNVVGAVMESIISSEAKIISYEKIVESQDIILPQLKKKSTNKNYQLYIDLLEDSGLYASIIGYDAIHVNEKGYVIILNSNAIKTSNIEYYNNKSNDLINEESEYAPKKH